MRVVEEVGRGMVLGGSGNGDDHGLVLIPQTCLREIRGAKYLTLEELEARGLVNEHIRELKRSQK